MSLEVPLLSAISIVRQPQIKETITDKIVIERVVDIPTEKKVCVFIRGRMIELAQLSGDNYDTPNEWTNADIISAVKAHFKI